MDIYEFYREIGVAPDDILNRLGSEVLIKKYLLKFCQDCSFFDLKQAVEQQRFPDAFRAAHTLKGICLNLELLPLTEISIRLTDILRNYEVDKAGALKDEFAKFFSAYTDVIAKIEKLK